MRFEGSFLSCGRLVSFVDGRSDSFPSVEDKGLLQPSVGAVLLFLGQWQCCSTIWYQDRIRKSTAVNNNATLSFGVHVHDMTAVTHLSVERLAVRMVPRFWEDSESTQHDKEGRSGFANADMRSASQCCRSPIELVDLEPSMSTLVPLLLPIAGNDEVLGVCLLRYVGVSYLSIFLPKVLSPVIDSISESHARWLLSGVSDSELLPLVKSSMRSGHEPQPSD